ncbi:hypothetical protein [Alicyclobacillus acidoterrestris]|uniref:Uncharacterized protein n=1 Tax=Alicyclobacillus acidoterrestris (strain ATCC 49025 / DSM 3922 / CIP 106132 / NCIMB 13137 / GD3B) TaxID=1356854 RepID=T0CTX9_ALIAG|nr:hypothetical protein [Alicyclobacillus acidoterrestris]EPZ41011.1 hypothetical protein N007_17450 [Alicyclobacillus acidoterrestris ATCC 49025]UNO47825.1 hypothetical protein K1I37_14165 [Alicyclobacillus acidoterrestris]GEO27171.1 hypothetical protein AAC03nite_29560 [Alicyclobacillus acidoterrestris]
MESKALKTFRRKMANPLHWHKANQIFLKYSRDDLKNVARTMGLIDVLASELGVTLNESERKQAAQWLVDQDIDPKSKRDRMMIWRKAK